MRWSPDVVVLGGGPAGSGLALLAARAGLRVTVIERARFPRDKVCGEFVSPEGRAVLERMGILDLVQCRQPPAMDSCRVSDRRGRRLDLPLPTWPGLGREALGISRAWLDSVLLEQAERAGCEVRQGWVAATPRVCDGRVRGVQVAPVGHPDDGEELRPALVVAADGRRSALARLLHPDLCDPRRSDAGSWFGLKLHLAGPIERLASRVELHLFDGGYAGLAPIEGGRINLCLMVRVAALRACGGSADRLLATRLVLNPTLADALAGTRPAGRWQSVGPLRFGARRPAAAGALFVGDAAGTVDPFCGEGVSHALCAAELALPSVIDAVRRGRLGEKTARAWNATWHQAFGPVTRRVRRLGHLLERPAVAEPVLGLMRGLGPRLAARVVTATRTAPELGAAEALP